MPEALACGTLRRSLSAGREENYGHRGTVLGRGSWTPGCSGLRSARSGCTWPPRARPPRPSGTMPRPSWFAAACLRRQTLRTRWEQVDGQDVQRWMVYLLGRYSQAYATSSTAPCSSSSSGGPPRKNSPTRWPGSIRPRSPRSPSRCSPAENCRRWRRPAGARVRPAPRRGDHRGVPGHRLRLAELAGIRYDPDDTRSDVDLWQREITVQGKAGKPRIVRFGYQAARHWTGTSGSWPGTPRRGGRSLVGVNNRGPLTPSGIYQISSAAGIRPVWWYTRTGSGITSATPGWTAAARRAT